MTTDAAAVVREFDEQIAELKGRKAREPALYPTYQTLALLTAIIAMVLAPIAALFGRDLGWPDNAAGLAVAMSAYSWLMFSAIFVVRSQRSRSIQAEIDVLGDKKRIALGLGLQGIDTADSRSYFDRLVTINVQNLADYYLLVKVHTNSSFTAAMAAGIVGFALILGAVMIGLANLPNASVIAPIAAASGVITEFIAAVFFYLYNRTVIQLKEYHDSLLRVQNVLLAFKIVSDTNESSERLRMTGTMLEYLMRTELRGTLATASNDAVRRVVESNQRTTLGNGEVF
jgi:hypothetical protein